MACGLNEVRFEGFVTRHQAEFYIVITQTDCINSSVGLLLAVTRRGVLELPHVRDSITFS